MLKSVPLNIKWSLKNMNLVLESPWILSLVVCTNPVVIPTAPELIQGGVIDHGITTSKSGLTLHDFELTTTCDGPHDAVADRTSCSVRWCIARVPMSVICHDYLRWPVVTNRIQSDPSYDGNRVVWGRSKLSHWIKPRDNQPIHIAMQ